MGFWDGLTVGEVLGVAGCALCVLALLTAVCVLSAVTY